MEKVFFEYDPTVLSVHTELLNIKENLIKIVVCHKASLRDDIEEIMSYIDLSGCLYEGSMSYTFMSLTTMPRCTHQFNNSRIEDNNSFDTFRGYYMVNATEYKFRVKRKFVKIDGHRVESRLDSTCMELLQMVTNILSEMASIPRREIRLRPDYFYTVKVINTTEETVYE